MAKTSIAIMIHDLNPWGGQDRSMLEIAWQLNKDFPLEIHSYSLEGYDNWPAMDHVKYESLIKRPIIFKYCSYHWQSWKKTSRRKQADQVIQSTGTASLNSDVVQVQFIHHHWEEKKGNLPSDSQTQQNFLKSLYHRCLARYNLALEKKIYKPSRHFIAISHGIKKELMTHFQIPSENISIIYHGVNTQRFCPTSESTKAEMARRKIRNEMGYAEDDIVFLHVGALNSRKGIFKALETIKLLKENGFDKIKYIAVGQGDKKALEAKIKEYNIEDRVSIISHSKKIREFYWAADLFFFPTFYEPFGLVILEAMSCGLPVATTSCAGAAELIDDGVNGLLLKTEDSPEDIINQLNPYLKSVQDRESLGIQARKTALSHSWKKVGEAYRDFYKSYKKS